MAARRDPTAETSGSGSGAAPAVQCATAGDEAAEHAAAQRKQPAGTSSSSDEIADADDAESSRRHADNWEIVASAMEGLQPRPESVPSATTWTARGTAGTRGYIPAPSDAACALLDEARTPWQAWARSGELRSLLDMDSVTALPQNGEADAARVLTDLDAAMVLGVTQFAAEFKRFGKHSQLAVYGTSTLGVFVQMFVGVVSRTHKRAAQGRDDKGDGGEAASDDSEAAPDDGEAGPAGPQEEEPGRGELPARYRAGDASACRTFIRDFLTCVRQSRTGMLRDAVSDEHWLVFGLFEIKDGMTVASPFMASLERLFNENGKRVSLCACAQLWYAHDLAAGSRI